MKKIGFIDYYLGEWHADNYPAWISEMNKKIGADFVLKYAYGEIDSLLDGRTSEQWCKQNGVERCFSIRELCEKSDYIMILAPSDPEKHLEYAKEVFKYKKTTYIDKTFAEDYGTAKKIFNLAEECGVRFFSTSALRYADELNDLVNVNGVITSGGGRSLEEYCVHQIEMIVKIIDRLPTRVKLEKQGNSQYIARIDFVDNKKATLLYSDAYPFSVCVEDADGNPIYRSISSDYFKTLIETILRFFLENKEPFDKNQTLSIMKIRENIIKAKDRLGEWIEI